MVKTNFVGKNCFEDYDKFLGKKDKKKLAYATYVERFLDSVNIVYHDTTIIRYYKDNFYVTNGGFWTRTTKDRINQFSPIYLYQKNFNWYFVNGELFLGSYRKILLKKLEDFELPYKRIKRKIFKDDETWETKDKIPFSADAIYRLWG